MTLRSHGGKKIFLCLFVFLTAAAGEMLGKTLTLLQAGTASDLKSAFFSSVSEGIALGAFAVILCIASYLILREELFEKQRRAARGVFPAAFLFILIAWLPCFLAYYPANYSYDGEPQLIQYTTGAFDNHHPIFHTLLLGGCYSIGQFLKGHQIPVDGMAIYSLLQSVLLAFALAKSVKFAARRGATALGTALLTLFFACFPMHPLMAVTTTKDTLFTAFLLLFLMRLADRLLPTGGKSGIREDVLLTADAAFMMLFRKNGFYILLPVVLLLFLAALYKKMKKGRPAGSVFTKTAFALLASLLLFTAADRGLMAVTGAAEGEAGEALSLPLQQIARTYKSNGESLTAEELGEITRYISEEGMDQYRPSISDGVKQNFNEAAFREDPIGFFRIWLKLFKKYPGSYGMAFLYQTMGAWYPGDLSHTEVYRNWWRDRVCYFVTDATPVFAGYDFVEQKNLLPAVRSFYESIVTELSYLDIPAARILFAPFFWCMGAVLLPLVLLMEKRRRAFLVSLPILGEWILVYLGPCVISRYIYPLMAALPILLVLCCETGAGQNGRKEENAKELRRDEPSSIIKESVSELSTEQAGQSVNSFAAHS